MNTPSSHVSSSSHFYNRKLAPLIEQDWTTLENYSIQKAERLRRSAF